MEMELDYNTLIAFTTRMNFVLFQWSTKLLRHLRNELKSNITFLVWEYDEGHKYLYIKGNLGRKQAISNFLNV